MYQRIFLFCFTGWPLANLVVVGAWVAYDCRSAVGVVCQCFGMLLPVVIPHACAIIFVPNLWLIKFFFAVLKKESNYQTIDELKLKKKRMKLLMIICRNRSPGVWFPISIPFYISWPIKLILHYGIVCLRFESDGYQTFQILGLLENFLVDNFSAP